MSYQLKSYTIEGRTPKHEMNEGVMRDGAEGVQTKNSCYRRSGERLSSLFYSARKSSRMRVETRRAETKAVGKPVPGCVLAPTKYRLW